MRSRAKIGGALNAAALHWFTYFVFKHGEQPRRTTEARDYDALREIVLVQCKGNERRACDLIEQIIDAPVPGDTLSGRYVWYWAYIEQGAWNAPVASESLRRDIRSCIRDAVAGAA